MSKILSKDKISELLHSYYKEHYGENENDIWFEPPATNVVCFQREDKIISLKCHILDGTVTEHIEEK